jgi:hypothetical protein
LIDFAEEAGIDKTTRTWVFQALRDITGLSFPPDPAVWRHWYFTTAAH